MSFIRSLIDRRLSPPARESAMAPSVHHVAAAAATPILALPAPRAEVRARYDLRNVSPRQYAEITHELYLEGSLRWDEYQWIGFPSELHPDYDSTIGALTGEKADPDRPRDMLAVMESHVDFIRRYQNKEVDGAFWRAERALDVLRRQTEPRWS